MRSKSMLIGLLVVGLGLLMVIEPATVQAQLSGVGDLGPITYVTTMDCDFKDVDFGSGSTLVSTQSESCAIDTGNGNGKGTGESVIDSCPAGWNDLTHSIDLQLEKSGFIVVCFANDEKPTSATAAKASCTGFHGNADFLATTGDHVYQITTGDPGDTRDVQTKAFLDL